MKKLTQKTLQEIYSQSFTSPSKARKLIEEYIREAIQSEAKKVLGQTMEVGVFKNRQHIKTFDEMDEAEKWLEKKLGKNLQRYSENYFFDKKTNDTYKLMWVSTSEASSFPSPIDAKIGQMNS